MTEQATGRAGWGPVAAAAVLLLVVAVTAAVLLLNRADDSGDPRDPEAQQELVEALDAAEQYLDSERFDEARVILDRVIEQFPESGAARVSKSKLLVAEGEIRQAYREAREGAELEPDAHEAHFFSGVLASMLREHEAARDSFARAVELAPDAAGYALYLAGALLRDDDLDGAETQATRARRLDASLHQAHAIQAEVDARRGDLDQALTRIDTALSLVEPEDRSYVGYTLQKAELLRRSGDVEAGLALLNALPPAQQQQQRVVEHLAESYLQLDQPDRAAAVWAELFVLEPDNVRAAVEAGKALVEAGEYEQAELYGEYARQISSSEHEAVRSLEEALQRAN